MEEEKEKKIKVIYSELRAYLAQAPIEKDGFNELDDDSIWEHYNGTVNLLSETSGNDYSRHCIEPSVRDSTHNPYVTIDTYRQRLSGLISSLREEYFSDEPDPLDGAPSTVITQSQHQGQSVHIQMIVDITDIINEKIGKYEDGSNEKSFLQKLKDSLSSVSNVKQLLQTIFELAKKYGLDMNEAFEIFTKTQ